MLFFIVLSAIALVSWQCGSSTTSTTSTDSSSSSIAFPDGLAIASPTDASEANTNISLIGKATSYEVEWAGIDTILNATSLASCAADFTQLFTQPSDANCYGPEMGYESHPESGTDGDLPVGDLGLWTENEGSSTEACAAAELNARMDGIKEQSTAALSLLASMVCTINNTSTLTMPSAGSSLSMASEMTSMATAAGATGMTFNSASISVASTTVGSSTYTDYTYSINISITGAVATTLQVDMTHRPLDSSNNTYRGRFSYYFDNQDAIGNCNRDFGALNTADITELGSVVYEKSASTSLKFDARYTQACGASNTAVLVSNELDPTVKAKTDNMAGGPDISGWAANFNKVVADFDPTTNIGNFILAWQAGAGDGAIRAFNLTLNDADSDGYLEGSAYYGFGDDIATATGDIVGMYCNWAGPNGGAGNNTSVRLDNYAQRQVIDESSSTGIFAATTSDILYAPTNLCDMDASDVTAGYKYDEDLDGTVDVISAFTHELIDITDATDGITASGFTLPTAPTGP